MNGIQQDKLFYQNHQNDINELYKKVLRTGIVVAGPQTKKLKERISEILDCKYVITVDSSHSAYRLAFQSIGVTNDTEIIISNNEPSYISETARFLGANVIETAVCDSTHNIIIDSVYKNINPKTKAIICNHHYGLPCDLDSFIANSLETNVNIIEHNSNALSANYKAFKVGTLGMMSITGFEPGSFISALGYGAIINTNSIDVANKIIDIKKKSSGLHLSEFQAAIILYKLERLDEIIACHQNIAHHYFKAFEKLPLTLPKTSKFIDNLHTQFIIQTTDHISEFKRLFASDNNIIIKEFDSYADIYLPIGLNIDNKLINQTIDKISQIYQDEED